MSDSVDNAAAVARVPAIFTKPPTNDGRRKQRAEWRAKAMVADVDALLKQYREKNPADFIMGKMLGGLRRLERALERAEQALNREENGDKRMEHALSIARIQKQQLGTLQAIAKFQETTYHSQVKESRRNRSAAPGQQVGNPQPTNESTVCSNPSASSAASS